ncbi:CI repressor [Yersinia intermedia]|nr:CI repressor [Yersinia intermedia]
MGVVNGDSLHKVNIDFSSGGAQVLDRIVTAYGFSSKIQLAQHFDIAGSSLSNRYKRDTFPSDFVVQCMAETGADLTWLVTGEGDIYGKEVESDTTLTIEKLKIVNGKLASDGILTLDQSFISRPVKQLQAVIDDHNIYLIDMAVTDLSDGKWLVDIEGNVSIRDLALIPVKRVHVTGGKVPFECDMSDIKGLGQVIGIYSEIK